MVKSSKKFVSIFAVMLMSISLIQFKPAMAADNPNSSGHYEVSISPIPQFVKQNPGGFEIAPEVALVTSDKTDIYAVQEVKEILKSAGVKSIVDKKAEEPRVNNQVAVWVGGPSEIPETTELLKSLDVEGTENLPPEGYVLAIGRDKHGVRNIVLAGKDKNGTFYAAQTLRQIIRGNTHNVWVPCIEVRDYPTMPYRGAIEGFYGTPWSHQNRLDQIDFYGKMKMNTYIYAPKDDPYHRDKWRDPYPADKLAQMQELVNRCKENHVNFNFAISPGLSIRFSNDDDFQALVNKAQAMYDLGVRTFSILLDDIDSNLRDPKDKEMFGKDKNPAAAAQSYLLNRFQKEFIKTHPGANPLETVPTEYYVARHTPYLDRMAELTDPDVVFMWTGAAVVPATITAAQAKTIKEVLNHPILIWYNYPVNDYCRNQLLMGPEVGLDPALCDNGIVGIVSNPMNEAEASKIPVFTIGDYNWNPKAYNPEDSWMRAMKDFGPNVADSLYTFSDSARSSRLSSKESTSIKPLADEFWDNFDKGDKNALKKTSAALIKEFEKVQEAPSDLRNNFDNKGFLTETDNYLTKLEALGASGVSAVKMMLGLANNDMETAWKNRVELGKAYNQAKAIKSVIGSRVIVPFVEKSLNKYGEMLNIGWIKPFSTIGTYSDYTLDKMIDGDASTWYWTDRNPNTGDYFGIDLGKPTDIYTIHILMGKDANATDYMRNAVVEYSLDNVNWTGLTEPLSVRDITLNNISIKARYVRLRCAAGYKPWWIQVREFSVNNKAGNIAISGTPAGEGGFGLLNIADRNIDTAYKAASIPTAEDKLILDFPADKHVEKILILQDPGAISNAAVEVKDSSGNVKQIGVLSKGYNDLNVGMDINQISIKWADNGVRPIIYEVIPVYE